MRRQLAMVMDLNKCIGCHTCTMACKTQWTNRSGREYMYWNNVETMPGRGYPRDWRASGGGFREGLLQEDGKTPSPEDYGIPWEYNYSEGIMKGGGHLRPIHNGRPVEPRWAANWDEDQGGGEFPNSHFFYLPRICNHCTRPACLEACPRKAIYKREEDGIVLIDQSRCRGYGECVKACPYKKVYFNHARHRSEKCIFCYPRLEQGMVNACAAQCVGRIRFVGWLDDEEGPVYRLVREWQVALPLHPEFGTGPNVFYVPPIHTTPPPLDSDGRIMEGKERIPIAYLESLFGPATSEAIRRVAEEIEKRRRGEKSALTEILIGYTNKDRFRIELPEPVQDQKTRQI